MTGQIDMLVQACFAWLQLHLNTQVWPRRCKGCQTAVKQMSIRRLPPVLCLHVKRFEHSFKVCNFTPHPVSSALHTTVSFLALYLCGSAGFTSHDV